MKPKRQKLLLPILYLLLFSFLILPNLLTAQQLDSSTIPTARKSRSVFAVYFNTGYSSWDLNDFNIPSDVTTDFVGSFSVGGGILAGYKFSDAHTLGLRAGYSYYPGGTFEHGAGFTSVLDLSAYAFPVDIFYMMPVKKSLPLFLRFGGGVDFFNSKIDYTFDPGNVSGEFKDSGIGYHFSLGANYFLNKNLALTFDVGYGFAKLDDFTGTVDGQESRLILEGIAIVHSPTDVALPPGVRQAEIDLSGLQVSAGLSLFFKSPETSSKVKKAPKGRGMYPQQTQIGYEDLLKKEINNESSPDSVRKEIGNILRLIQQYLKTGKVERWEEATTLLLDLIAALRAQLLVLLNSEEYRSSERGSLERKLAETLSKTIQNLIRAAQNFSISVETPPLQEEEPEEEEAVEQAEEQPVETEAEEVVEPEEETVETEAEDAEPEQAEQDEPETETAEPDATEVELILFVHDIEGIVSVLKPGRERWRPARLNQRIRQGYRVQTGMDSTLFLGNGDIGVSFSISSTTLLTITRCLIPSSDINRTETHIDIMYGGVSVNVAQGVRRTDMQVAEPNIIAGVTGRIMDIPIIFPPPPPAEVWVSTPNLTGVLGGCDDDSGEYECEVSYEVNHDPATGCSTVTVGSGIVKIVDNYGNETWLEAGQTIVVSAEGIPQF